MLPDDDIWVPPVGLYTLQLHTFYWYHTQNMLLGMRMMNFQNDITISLFPVFHEKIKMRPLLLVASTLPLLSTHHN